MHFLLPAPLCICSGRGARQARSMEAEGARTTPHNPPAQGVAQPPHNPPCKRGAIWDHSACIVTRDPVSTRLILHTLLNRILALLGSFCLHFYIGSSFHWAHGVYIFTRDPDSTGLILYSLLRRILTSLGSCCMDFYTGS